MWKRDHVSDKALKPRLDKRNVTVILSLVSTDCYKCIAFSSLLRAWSHVPRLLSVSTSLTFLVMA